nr:PREDICTED: class I histocompatibility antigen, F10 alpha chain-like [Lepisosteus oculatus]
MASHLGLILLFQRACALTASVERPLVSLSHKDSGPGGTELTCLATGFFPRDIVLSWWRDGQELQEDVESGGVVPNGDGSFQVRKSLRVRAGEEDKYQYSCRVDHTSLEEEIIRIWERPGRSSALSALALLPLALLVPVIALGVMLLLQLMKTVPDFATPDAGLG